MRIIDFGKNAFHFGLYLKFPSLSGEIANRLIRDLVTAKGIFKSVLKGGEPPALLTISTGDGSETSPLQQLRLAGDFISLWAGWHLSFDNWKTWRDSLAPMVVDSLKDVPSELVASIFSQVSTPVPADRVKPLSSIDELRPIHEIYERFLPSENRQRGSSLASFEDAQGKKTVEWWMGGWDPGSAIPGYTNITLGARLNILEPGKSLNDAIREHTAWSDDVVAKFHSHFLSLLITHEK